MFSILFKKSFPLADDFKDFLHSCGFFGGGQADVPDNVIIDFMLNLFFNPELKVWYLKSGGQSIYFVYYYEYPMFTFIDKIVYLFNLTAFKIGNIYHIDYYWSWINVLEKISDDVSAIKVGDIIR